jgi:PAS domain S-box-containing protein
MVLSHSIKKLIIKAFWLMGCVPDAFVEQKVEQDMIDGKQPEERLSEQEREFADFVENAVVSLHWVGADGTILWANQAELDLLGYTREEYIGHNIAEFHVDQPVIEDILARLSAWEQVNNNEARLRCKDGSIRQVLISSSVRFEDEQFIHTRCFTLDITERKQAEDRILLLYQLTAALSEALNLQQVAQVIVEQGVPKLEARAGSVVLLNKDTGMLEVLAAIGYEEQLIQAWQHFPVDSPTPLAESVRTQQPIWLSGKAEFQSRFPAIELPPDQVHVAWVTIPLMIEKRILGALGFSFSTPQKFDEPDRRFMLTLAQQCAQALERARLSEEARELAVLEERQRLARDLHDAVSQTLFSISTLAQALPRLLERDPKQGHDQLQQLATISMGAQAEMRTLLLELRPASLVNASMQELLTQLVQSAQARKQIAFKIQVELEQALPEAVHVVLYRIAQESLNNIVKHSQATAGSISLTKEAGQLVLRIRDNGRGFDLHALAAGLGMGVMRERAALIGATLEINSNPGKGTEIVVTWSSPTDAVDVQ